MQNPPWATLIKSCIQILGLVVMHINITIKSEKNYQTYHCNKERLDLTKMGQMVHPVKYNREIFQDHDQHLFHYQRFILQVRIVFWKKGTFTSHGGVVLCLSVLGLSAQGSTMIGLVFPWQVNHLQSIFGEKNER